MSHVARGINENADQFSVLVIVKMYVGHTKKTCHCYFLFL